MKRKFNPLACAIVVMILSAFGSIFVGASGNEKLANILMVPFIVGTILFLGYVICNMIFPED